MTIIYKGGGSAEDAAAVPPYPTNYNPRKLGPRPAYGFYVRHVRGLTFRNVKVGFEAPDPRPAFAVLDADGLEFQSVVADRASQPALPSLHLRAVRGLTIRDSTPLPDKVRETIVSEVQY